ncbi:transposase [Neorhizobium galegae]|uniref:transposase n=1 Tax=Neorhizobium galegae TaxID=399 RepID=UPI00351D670C
MALGRDGQRRHDPASIDRLLAACLEPGVSVSRLVLEQGVNANLVRKWIKRAQQVRSGPVASAHSGSARCGWKSAGAAGGLGYALHF